MPVFILGSPRSGTTAMAMGLARLKRFGRYRLEGHFLYHFHPGLVRVATGRVGGNSIVMEAEQAARFIGEFKRSVNRLYSETGDPDDEAWIDKTPDHKQAAAIPSIDALWPDARYIFLYRPPLQAVRASAAMPHWKLEGHEGAVAQRWVECQAAWRRHRDRLKGRAVEVFQPDMLADPAGTAAALAPLLDLSDDEVNMLTTFWSKNDRLNRPSKPEAEKAYDLFELSKAARDEVAAITSEEAARWPRLADHGDPA
ncbi:hypothetical protein DLJ53_00425 [Acuticoccus sediminis]|uniref:Sulfotransferase family protein n=1 Tax=Acuticoccus sediminis TaxID=2184697 RepID=A0A8B2P354_9HYPH|nr:sulfotransferase [Acuticoccus sediminis]RAI03039.1 hypothetical protein DLJ53_00425 [Acuticoccus sediminis]